MIFLSQKALILTFNTSFWLQNNLQLTYTNSKYYLFYCLKRWLFRILIYKNICARLNKYALSRYSTLHNYQFNCNNIYKNLSFGAKKS